MPPKGPLFIISSVKILGVIFIFFRFIGYNNNFLKFFSNCSIIVSIIFLLLKVKNCLSKPILELLPPANIIAVSYFS